MIFTKSISRFARNTLDTLNCVRELKNLTPPVEVIFEKEHLRTLDAQGELVLTIMSALAQDESRSISENIKWSLQKKFQNGIPMVNLELMLGYDKGPNGEWVINEEQAEIVRFIYREYADGATATAIAKALNEKGIKTVRGNKWRADAIMLILRNEKYAGHVTLQKTYTKDFLTHRAVRNNGDVPQFTKENHHPPIVDAETLQLVEDRLAGMEARKAERRNQKGGRAKPVLWNLTTRMADGQVIPMKRMSYRGTLPGASYQYPVWKTANITKIPGLDRAYIHEIAVEQSFMEMLYRMKREYEEQGENWAVWKAVEAILTEMDKDEGAQQKLALLNAEIEKTEEARRTTAVREMQMFQISGDSNIYSELLADLGKKLDMLREQRTEIESRQGGNKIRLAFRSFLQSLQSLPTTNALGKKLMVNTVDADGSLLVTASGEARTGKRAAIHSGQLKLTQERLDAAPEMPVFNALIYDTFITGAEIQGDEIEFTTTFGVKIRSKGNSRTLRGFLGFKRVSSDGKVEFLDETWKVNGRTVTPEKKKEEPAE